MLATLETGVKGGKWFSLVDKVWREENLRTAFERVAANKGSAGVDHVGVAAYGGRLEVEIAKLAEELRAGTYRPQPLRRAKIGENRGQANSSKCENRGQANSSKYFLNGVEIVLSRYFKGVESSSGASRTIQPRRMKCDRRD
jgi:hypothetical protein